MIGKCLHFVLSDKISEVNHKRAVNSIYRKLKCLEENCLCMGCHTSSQDFLY